jgi:hypothetical protein
MGAGPNGRHRVVIAGGGIAGLEALLAPLLVLLLAIAARLGAAFVATPSGFPGAGEGAARG